MVNNVLEQFTASIKAGGEGGETALVLELENENKAVLRRYDGVLALVNELEAEIEALSDSALRQRSLDLKSRVSKLPIKEREDESTVVEAFALVREAAWRVLELRPYDVQLAGGLAILEGRLAEMATGEGKTLAAVAPTYLAALRGQGALVVTANDYLAQRDADCVGQVHRFLGLTVGLVQSSMAPGGSDRKDAYSADITYGTNAELGFDYLRDNLAQSPEEPVLRATRYFCLVDEADSILIDEARTPLIISKQGDPPREKYGVAAQVAQLLRCGKDYLVDEKAQRVTLTEGGATECETVLQKSLYDSKDAWLPFINNALKAKELLKRDITYLVRDNEIVIVDPLSGRPMEGRRWSDGLHQSVEVKESLAPSNQSEPSAQVTYQSLFRQWPRLCGMTGTAITDAYEFSTVYGLRVTPIPTALPVARKDYDDAVYRTQTAKITAVIREVQRVQSSSQPVLIGTTSVEDSENIVSALSEVGINAAVLNARPENAALEGRLVAQAGRLGQVTVATNMAGRGTDIRLGGNAAEFTKLKLIDFLVDTLGAGSESPYTDKWIPVDQELWPCALSDGAVEALREASRVVAARYDADDLPTLDELDELVAVAAESSSVTNKVLRAARDAFAAVKEDFDQDVTEQREQVKNSGGLYIIGTERHESRRIDNQLRGRAGRQGDPGSSRFFLSLEDTTFRLFGGDRLTNLMQTFRLGDDIPLESKQVTKTLNQVQIKVEEYFNSIRSSLLEFDEILAIQRDTLYSIRAKILTGDQADSETLLTEWCVDTMKDLLRSSTDDEEVVDVVAVHTKATQFFGKHFAISADELAQLDTVQLETRLIAVAEAASQAKLQELESSQAGLGISIWRYFCLVQMDTAWSKQLVTMDLLKETVQMRKYQGLNPLDEYRSEGVELFKALRATTRRDAVFSYFAYSP